MKTLENDVSDKKSITVSNVLKIKKIEHYFKVKLESTLPEDKSDVLSKNVLFSSRKKRGRNKIPVVKPNIPAIKKFERFFGVEAKNSLFYGKLNILEKQFILSARKDFAQKIEGKPWEIFTKGRFIYYCITYNDYYVRDALTGQNVGEAVMENDWLQNIEVISEYQKQGIGTNLMRAIVKTLGKDFLIPAKGEPGITSYYMTDAGAALINSCLRKKIITEEQCLVDVPLTPTRSPQRF